MWGRCFCRGLRGRIGGSFGCGGRGGSGLRRLLDLRRGLRFRLSFVRRRLSRFGSRCGWSRSLVW